jgi:hypothetical protein
MSRHHSSFRVLAGGAVLIIGGAALLGGYVIGRDSITDLRFIEGMITFVSIGAGVYCSAAGAYLILRSVRQARLRIARALLTFLGAAMGSVLVTPFLMIFLGCFCQNAFKGEADLGYIMASMATALLVLVVFLLFLAGLSRAHRMSAKAC